MRLFSAIKRRLCRKRLYYTTSVFKTNGIPEFTFVKRDEIEDNLDETVSDRNKLLLFLGYSKSGKTVYRKKYFDSRDFKQIIFRCNRDSTLRQLYSFICSEADLPFPAAISKQSSQMVEQTTVSGASGQGFKFDSGSKSAKTESEQRTAHYPELEIDANHICNNLTDRKNIIVLEDFHLVSDVLSSRLSEDLKHFLDEGILFLVIGIPSSPGRALKNNPDLGGRTKRIVFDYLRAEEIEALIDKGEEKLNVVFALEVRDRIREKSMQNAYLVQAISQHVLLNRNIKKTTSESIRIADKREVDKACISLAAELASDFKEIVAAISAGQRKQRGGKSYNQYEEILRAVRDSDIETLEDGISYQLIGQNTLTIFPPARLEGLIRRGVYKDEISFKTSLHNQISQALNRLEDTLEKANARQVLIYNDKKLYLMDLVFKFFLEWHDGVIQDLQ